MLVSGSLPIQSEMTSSSKKRPLPSFLRVSEPELGLAGEAMVSTDVGNPMKERERDGVTRHGNSPLVHLHHSWGASDTKTITNIKQHTLGFKK